MTGNVCVNVTLRHARLLHVKKKISIKYSECVFVALIIRQPTRMLNVLSSVACLILPYSFTLSHKRQDFREKKLLNIKCVF